MRTRDADTVEELTASSFNHVGERASQDPVGATATGYDYDQAGRLTNYHAPAGDPSDPNVECDYDYDGDGLRTDLSGTTPATCRSSPARTSACTSRARTGFR